VEFFAFLRVLHHGALATAFSVRDVLAWSAFVADTAADDADSASDASAEGRAAQVRLYLFLLPLFHSRLKKRKDSFPPQP